MSGDEIVPGMSEPLDVTPGEPAPTAAATPHAPRRFGTRTAVVTVVALGVAAGGGAFALAAGGGHGSSAAGRGGFGTPGGGPGGPGGYAGPGGTAPGAAGGEGGSGTAPEGTGGGSGSLGGGTGGAGSGGRGPGGPAGGGVVHGTFVVPESSSSTTTETDDVQQGTVTAISSTSITVKSADGFTRSYVLDSSTKVDGGQGSASAVKTADTVSLVATETDGTATVTTLADRSQAKKPTAPAATTSPEATPPATAPSPGSGKGTGVPPAGAGGHGPGGFGGGFGGGDDLLFRALHGSYVVATTSGTATTYATDVVQSGDVTALSATSISLKSTDGYTATYVIGSATKKDSSVATGKDASVVATGTPATATSVRAAGTHAGPGGSGGSGGYGGGMPGGWGGAGGSGYGGAPGGIPPGSAEGGTQNGTQSGNQGGAPGV